MASEVEICNMALLKFGDKTITALTDATKEARACKVFYPLLREQLVYSHPWNFALKRADISAQLATAPAFGYEYAYTLPVDCLRVLELYGSDAEWAVESGLLLTDQEEEIYVRYIWKVTTTGNFTSAFCNCLSTLLAAEIAPRIAGDSGKAMKQELLQELHQIWLPEARQLNAIEGARKQVKGEQPLETGNFSWQTEGR